MGADLGIPAGIFFLTLNILPLASQYILPLTLFMVTNKSLFATPLYPQKLALNFVDKWRSLSRYSSLAD
jgi:hypothetical protein